MFSSVVPIVFQHVLERRSGILDSLVLHFVSFCFPVLTLILHLL